MTQSNARMYQIALKGWKVQVFHCRPRNMLGDGNQGKYGLTSSDSQNG